MRTTVVYLYSESQFDEDWCEGNINRKLESSTHDENDDEDSSRMVS